MKTWHFPFPGMSSTSTTPGTDAVFRWCAMVAGMRPGTVPFIRPVLSGRNNDNGSGLSFLNYTDDSRRIEKHIPSQVVVSFF